MINNISLHTFNELSQERKLGFICENAKYLSSRTLSDLNVELYMAQNFFVELWYEHTKAEGIMMMKTFSDS